MLEPVALNQTRFNTPGIAPDNRGVVLGKQGALLFASADRLVGFFRVFCDESSMDDLAPKLKILQVRTPLQSREFLLFFHAASSYLCDRAARIAGLFGGLAFTGSGKHYVKYRDGRSPLGYDIAALHTEPADFVLYADAFTQGYTRVKELPFDQLVFRLSLERIPAARRRPWGATVVDEARDPREQVWLVVRDGLAAGVLGYLWRNRVTMEASRVAAHVDGSAFVGGATQTLVRVQQLPPRMLRLFQQVPGIEVHRPVGESCIVELGFRHPLRLESCTGVFDKQRFYIFSGTRDTVDVVVGPPPLVPGQDLIGSGFDLSERPPPALLGGAPAPQLEVRLKLVPSSRGGRRVTATLVPWGRVDWLRRLVYALPPTMLGSYRVTALTEGLFVVGEQGIDGLPVGTLYQEAAPSIFVPVGTEFLPRVSPEVLTEHLGGVAGRYLLFPLVTDGAGDARALALDHASFEPLGRRALARLTVEPRERDARMPPARTVTPATVVNEELGLMPLWGFKDK
jgi:hypothetical protein